MEPDSPTDVQVDKASREYQSQFDLPSDEILVDSFVCALQKGILHQGRMSISQHYVCFYSNILVSEAKLVIRADQIEEVHLAKVLFFPTAIRIVHSGGIDSLFASFLSRERAYALIAQVSHGEQIGGQRVLTSNELDRIWKKRAAARTTAAAEGPNARIAPIVRLTDKHQQLLNRKTTNGGGGSTTTSPNDKVKSPNDTTTPVKATFTPTHNPNSNGSGGRTRNGRSSFEDEQKESDDGSDVQRHLAKFQRPKGNRGREEKEQEEMAREEAAYQQQQQHQHQQQPETTLQRLGSMLTAVHVSQPPRAASNSIATPHGVVVIEDDPHEVLPTGARFKHVRTGSLAIGADGPQAAMVDTSPNPANRQRVESRGAGGAAIAMDGHAVASSRSPNGSPVLRPIAPGSTPRTRGNSGAQTLTPPTIGARNRTSGGGGGGGGGSSREASDQSDVEDQPPSSRPGLTRPKSAARQVALAMKPRAGKSRKARRDDSDEEEDD